MVAALSLAACSSNPANPAAASGAGSPSGAPVKGGTISVGLQDQGNSLLPSEANWDTSSINIARAIYDPLVREASDGSYRPYLAESLKPNADLTQWTLTLRPGVKFSDGTPLTAQSIADDFNDFLTKPTSVLAGSLAIIKDFKVTGPLTGVYQLTSPNAGLPDLVSGPAGWVFSADAAKKAGGQAGTEPVGTGPFKVTQVVPNSQTTVVRNPDYWQKGQPYLDKIVFKPIPDEDARLAGLQSGQLQVITTERGTTMTQLAQNAKSGQFQYLPYNGNRASSAVFNMLVPPVNDLRVRQAIAMAVDQEASAEVLGFKGLAQPATQYYSKDSPWYDKAAATEYPAHNVAEAKKLIGEYVSSPTRSDGKTPGTPLQVNFQCIGGATVVSAVQLLQADLNDIGVKMNVNTLDQSVLISNVIGSANQKPPFSGNFQISCWAAGSDVAGTQDPYNVFAAEYSSATSPTDYTNWTTSALQAAIKVLGTTTDVAARKADIAKINKIIIENQVIFFSGGSPVALAASPEVGGLANWKFPDGSPGNGHPDNEETWGQAWLAR